MASPFKQHLMLWEYFYLKLLEDNSITQDIVEKIFIEIVEAFPTKISKKDFGQMLLEKCRREIKNSKSKFVVSLEEQFVDKKIEKLAQAIGIFDSGTDLWTPNKNKYFGKQV